MYYADSGEQFQPFLRFYVSRKVLRLCRCGMVVSTLLEILRTGWRYIMLSRLHACFNPS